MSLPIHTNFSGGKKLSFIIRQHDKLVDKKGTSPYGEEMRTTEA